MFANGRDEVTAPSFVNRSASEISGSPSHPSGHEDRDPPHPDAAISGPGE